MSWAASARLARLDRGSLLLMAGGAALPCPPHALGSLPRFFASHRASMRLAALRSCESLAKWLVKCRDDSETYNWLVANTKACPKCQTSIEKNGGCNHMT